MKIAEICIRRPVLATVMSLVIILLGVVTWWQLPLRQYPEMETPVISITTSLSGASPEIIEAQITKPLENVFAGMQGVDFMVSSSEIEQSKLKLIFRSDRPIDSAAADVRDRLSRARAVLPQEVEEPTISKADADAMPIIFLALSSDRLAPRELADYATRFIENELESMPGVSHVEVSGGGTYEMHIFLDPIKLAAFKLTTPDVMQILRRQNIEKPGGRLISDEREFLVTTTARLSTPEQFEDIVLMERDGYQVRIKDVGSAKVDAKDIHNKVWFNGKTAVGVSLYKQSTANPLEIAKHLKKKLIDIRDRLPKDMKLDVASDRTIFIERSIDQVYQTIIEATILVVLVIWGFLGSLRASIIPLVTIPVSLIGTFTLIYMLGFSINTLTLLAMVLAIGLVVDDAIVMLENIYRYIEEGMKPIPAAFKGSQEISFAVIAMTLTLAAVYAPIALSTGITGKIFTEFALTLAGSVMISGFIALTLSPMMCSKLLLSHDDAHHGKFTKKWMELVEHFYQKAEVFYEKGLDLSIRKRLIVVSIGLVVALGGYGLGAFVLKSELAPKEDQSAIFGFINGPQGATMDFMDRYVRQVDEIIATVPEADSRYLQITVPTGWIRMGLVPWEERKPSSHEIIEKLRFDLEKITGITARIYNPRSIAGGGDGSSVQIVIQSSKSHEELREITSRFIQVLHRYPGLINIESDSGIDSQDFVIDVDRKRAASVSVDVASIAESVDALVAGRKATKFRLEDKEYDVRVELEDRLRRGPKDLESIFVRGENRSDNKAEREVMIPLSDLVTIKGRSAPIQLNHFNQLRSITISAELKPGYTLGEAVDALREIGKRVLPENARMDFAGETRQFIQESNSIFLIFGLALAFIYLVMAAQFESFIDPFIIMLSVPLSITGGLLALALAPTGTLNLFSQIGLVTLIGLITKHGILIVDFANKLREEGHDMRNAVIQASKLRLRPILMTTFAMVLGAIPLAFASGAGAEGRTQIGLVVVGGMSLGTLFTLFVVPAVYTYLSRTRKKIE